jgi:hypothetical protein
MWHDSAQLLDVNNDFGQFYRPKDDLPQIVPRFFVPPLKDKPQNPILEALKLENINSNLPPRLFQPHLLPRELVDLSLKTNQIVEQEPEAEIEDIWKNALIRRHGVRVRFIFNLSILFHDTVAEWFTLMGPIKAHALKQSIVHRIPVRARPEGLCICSLPVSRLCSQPYKRLIGQQRSASVI